jgi:type II protein arginine methyltransferase
MDVDKLVAQAVERYVEGDFDVSARLFEAVLELEPTNAVASHQLGLMAFAKGDVTSAVSYLRRAVCSERGDPERVNNLGVVLRASGDLIGARAAFESALAHDATFAQAANNLGATLEDLGEDVLAIGAYRLALEIDPGYVEARDNLLLACDRLAPPWHFPMMADAPRNSAYDLALRRAAPGKTVLDIGTGAGLLAMMAARAGAKAVTTCEAVPPIAAAAREIIATNGLADRITVHAKRSTELNASRDLEGRAEVLVTETFASGLLSESVLPTIEHAHQHLVAPGATIIPQRATAVGYLVGGGMVADQLSASASAGFDVSGFDLFAPLKVGIHLDRITYEIMSDDFEIFSFDLTLSSFLAERKLVTVTATSSGRCVAVAQWLRLDLDSQTTYENRPHKNAAANGWMHVLYRFREPLDLEVGQTVQLVCSHNRRGMTVALA